MSDKEITKEEIDHDLGHEDDDKHKKVTVTVDTKTRARAPWHLHLLGIQAPGARVEPDYELEQIIHGQLTPLADDAKIAIKGGEVFVSHARQGGSS